MNVELLKKAHERVPSVPVLVNLISKREKQLIAGEKPLVKPLSSDEDKVDTALREVAEGKLISEIDFDAIARAEAAKTAIRTKAGRILFIVKLRGGRAVA